MYRNPTSTRSTSTNGPRSAPRRTVNRSLTLSVIAVVVALAATVVPADAASWIYKENDKIRASGYGLEVFGGVKWYYVSNNSNNRYVSYGVQAVQMGHQYRAYCVGTKVLFRTESTQHTVGGSVSGGWSLTGPSGSVSGSYSRTKLGGTTSDGFTWRCPRNQRDYIRDDSGGGINFHPLANGKVTHVAVMSCLSDNPAGTNRWCTPWDVNSFGGR